MTKTKKKRREELRNKKQAKQFFTGVAVATFILLVLLYLLFANS